MRACHRTRGGAAAVLGFLTVAALPAVVQAGVIGALVPAYFYPGFGGPGGAGDGWAAMASAAGQISLTAIFNPNSGPLPGAPDANYLAAMTNLESAGGHVIAYIATDYTSNSLSMVESEANMYRSQYGSLINGFFIDEMTNSNNPTDLSYYHTLYSYLKGLTPVPEIVGNPGSPTVPDYLTPATQGADVLVTYENDDTAQSYASTPPSSWTSSYPAGDFANIVYHQSSAAGMAADVNAAATYNIGSLYVTDQTLPNPYGQLPSYWDQEVAALRAASTPEPATFALWSFAAILVSPIVAAKRRQRRASLAPAA